MRDQDCSEKHALAMAVDPATLNGNALGDRVKVGRSGRGDRPPAKKPTDETVANHERTPRPVRRSATARTPTRRARNSPTCPTAPTRRARSFVVSTNVAVTSCCVKNNGRVAIATLPDDAALQAILTLNGSVLGDRPVKVGRYFGAWATAAGEETDGRDRGEGTRSDERRKRRRRRRGHVTYALNGANFAVGVREESVQSLAKDAIAALELFDMTPGARPRRGDVEGRRRRHRALREALTKGAGRVQGIDVVGFDTETKPVFVAGRPPNDVALVQLAVRGLIVLVRLDLIGGMPDSLRRLLEDASVLKVGVGCAGDEQR